VDATITRDGDKVRVSLKRQPNPESSGPAAKIAYVLDVSWSMNAGGKMSKAHDALHKALDELRPDDQFTIVTFANDARSMPRMLSATRAGLSIGHANVSASQPEPGGATNLSAALDLALGLPGITHVFVLSDGEPTEGITDPNELLAFARKKNARKARIITMALINTEDKKGFTLLKEIAEQHNGLFDFVDLR
jgi:Ca-activated chloride channel homolog